MQFSILGSFAVEDEGRPLSAGGAKQSALLAIMLLHANQIVSSDRLVEELWSRPPPTARTALQVYVAQLRKVLEPQRPRGAPGRVILTRAPGYLLRIRPEQLDSARFEDLVAEARAARTAGEERLASKRLRQALSLWRGHALADFVYEPFAQAEIARLEELRMAALEERIDADLALGAGAELVGELEALLREHPLRERPRGQLMLALYRAGRQTEALEAYMEAHRTLGAEVGVAPGPALQRLHREILRHDPVLEASTQPVRDAAQEVDGGASAETRRTVTVLSVGRAARADDDPEMLRHLGAVRRDVVSNAVERHGGTVQPGRGHDVLAVFGVPFAHEDDALRAVRAAVEIRDCLFAGEGERAEAAVTAGIATGEVVTAESPVAGTATTGPPIVLARELEATAPPGEIRIAGETHVLVREVARTEPAGEPGHPAWRLVALEAEPPPLARSVEGPMIGRGAEVAQVLQAFERAARHRTLHLLTVLGPPGIGKSRLGEEVAASVGEQATVLAGRCLPYGEGVTFWPLRQMVAALGGAGAVADLLATEEQAGVIAARVSEAIGPAEVSSSREEIFWAFGRLFDVLARERPLLVLFEDLHWAEPTLLDFLAHLAERGRTAAMLVLCLARPELLERRPAWGGGGPNAGSLLLEPLSDRECETLIGTRHVRLDERTRLRLLEVADGNPLFLEQMLASLADRPGPRAELPIPPTIQAVLAARLDRLGPGERAVIERAAIVGREFSVEAAMHLLPADARRFAERHVEALARKELVGPIGSPSAGTFRFRHALIQQAAHRAIPKRLRGTLHERFADWLERGAGAETTGEIVGYHLEQAVRCRTAIGPVGEEERALAGRAADHLAAAGRQAFLRGDMPASAGLLDRAASLLPEDDPARLRLQPDLGYALFEIGEPERASALLADAAERARANGEPGVAWRAVVKRGHVQMYLRPDRVDLGGLARDAHRAVEVLDTLGDDAGLARAWMLASDVEWMAGRLQAGAAAAGRAVEHARRAGGHREESWCLGAQAMCMLYGRTPADDALGWLERMLGDVGGDPVSEASLSAFVASHEAMKARFGTARARIAESRALSRDLGLRWLSGMHAMFSAEIGLLAGDPAAAERDFRAAGEVFREIGDRWLLADVAVGLARAVVDQHRHDDALVLAGAIDDVPATSDLEWQIKSRDVRARVLAACGRAEEAVTLAGESIALGARSEFMNRHGDAHLGLTEALAAAGRYEAAARSAEEAQRLYERKGNLAGTARARALAVELLARAP